MFQRKLGIFIDLANNLLLEPKIPKHIPLIIKDLASFRLGLHITVNKNKTEDITKTFLKVPFHNKGIDMVNLSKIYIANLVNKSIPSFIQNQTPQLLVTLTQKL